jgi:hypothetical protein
MSWIARLVFVPIGISIADACTVVDTIKAQNTVANARILKSVFRLVKMAALGIALIVIGLTLVCGSMIFLLFREPSSSEESFEESLERIDERRTTAALPVPAISKVSNSEQTIAAPCAVLIVTGGLRCPGFRPTPSSDYTPLGGVVRCRPPQLA